MSLAIRSVLMTTLFPGFVVGLVPFAFILDAPRFPTEQLLASHYGGLFMILLGLAVLFRSIWEFAHYGRGTLAPFDEPQKLVIQGLYKYVRNPMYVGVYSILLGEAMFFQSADILIWFTIFFVASNAVVILFEEPNLKNKYEKHILLLIDLFIS